MNPSIATPVMSTSTVSILPSPGVNVVPTTFGMNNDDVGLENFDNFGIDDDNKEPRQLTPEEREEIEKLIAEHGNFTFDENDELVENDETFLTNATEIFTGGNETDLESGPSMADFRDLTLNDTEIESTENVSVGTSSSSTTNTNGPTPSSRTDTNVPTPTNTDEDSSTTTSTDSNVPYTTSTDEDGPTTTSTKPLPGTASSRLTLNFLIMSSLVLSAYIL